MTVEHDLRRAALQSVIDQADDWRIHAAWKAGMRDMPPRNKMLDAAPVVVQPPTPVPVPPIQPGGADPGGVSNPPVDRSAKASSGWLKTVGLGMAVLGGSAAIGMAGALVSNALRNDQKPETKTAVTEHNADVLRWLRENNYDRAPGG